MFVSTCRPQPARDAFGYEAYIASTSGRAPSTSVASPMNTSLPLSPAMASRYTDTRTTPTSSSAQPLTLIAPVTPLWLSEGVSIIPNGGADDDPACAITIERPATSRVADRVVAPGFESTVSVSVFPPSPDASLRRTHVAVDDVVQAHDVDSVIVDVPPSVVHDVCAAAVE